MILCGNAILCVGLGLTQIENISALLIGRFIYGLGIGFFVYYVPRFID